MKNVITNVYWYTERSIVACYLILAIDEDGGVDSLLLEAIRASKIGIDDIVG